MTTAGIQVTNASGYLQIDQDYANLAVIASGTVTTSTDAGYAGGGVQTGSVSVTGSNPVIAFNFDQDVVLSKVTNSGSTWTFYLSVSGGSSVTVSYWIFDNPSLLTISDNFGLAVYKSDGTTLAYHSSIKHMRIVDYITVSNPATTDAIDNLGISDTSATYTTGRSYAAIQASMFVRAETYDTEIDHGPLSPGQKWMDTKTWRGGARFNNTTATVSVGLNNMEYFYNSYSTSTTFSASQWGGLSWIIVDVTNY